MELDDEKIQEMIDSNNQNKILHPFANSINVNKKRLFFKKMM